MLSSNAIAGHDKYAKKRKISKAVNVIELRGEHIFHLSAPKVSALRGPMPPNWLRNAHFSRFMVHFRYQLVQKLQWTVSENKRTDTIYCSTLSDQTLSQTRVGDPGLRQSLVESL